jgi:DNA mismatch repair protein MutS2
MHAARTLEFDLLLKIISLWAHSPEGREEVLSWRPFERREAAIRGELITDVRRFLEEGEEVNLHDLRPMEPAWAALRLKGRAWDADTAWNAGALLRMAGRLQRAAASCKQRMPRFLELTEGLFPFPEYTRQFQRILEWRDQEKCAGVREDASPALVRIRRAQKKAREAALHCANAMLEDPGRKEAFAEAPLTIRDGRFVLGVRSGSRRKIDGIVHDRSGSGATFFMEPQELVPMNNRLMECQIEARREEERLLLELTDLARPHAEAMARNIEILVLLDGVAAAARFSMEMECVPASRAEETSLALVEARHPFLDRRLRSKAEALGVPAPEAPGDAVPVSLKILPETKVLLLTGPNTGGKTVLLKTVGLFVLMAETGLPVPAREAALPSFDAVFADIGDVQDIFQNLSTFSGHVKNVADMLEHWNEPALVLLDELGTGTDPDEGAALAMALLENLMERRAFVLATTHHGELKAYAQTRAGMQNATMEFDETTLKPTYRLLMGLPGRSRAFEIARNSGLPEELLDAARGFQRHERRRMEEVLEELEKARQTLQGERASLVEERVRADNAQRKARELEKDLRREKTELAANLRRRIAGALNDFEKSLKRLKEETPAPAGLKEAIRAARSEAAAIAAHFAAELEAKGGAASPETFETPPPPGTRVLVMPFHQSGEVLRVHSDSSVEVDVSGKRVKVPLSALRTPAAGEKPGRWSSAASPHWPGSAEGGGVSEIQLIGSRVEDAIPRLEKFLDDARVANRRQLRIVHGKGTGKLRKAIREYLKEQPFVVAVQDSDAAQGGAGVTVVELEG